MLQWILGRFDISLNEFEKRIAKKSHRGGTFNQSYLCQSKSLYNGHTILNLPYESSIVSGQPSDCQITQSTMLRNVNFTKETVHFVRKRWS